MSDPESESWRVSRIVYHVALYAEVMFEGHIKHLGLDETDESSVLRHMRWTDLVARLEATRELRAELKRSHSSSFTAFSAQLGEAPGDGGGTAEKDQFGENGKRGINQDVLSHGKFSRRRPVAVANDAAHGDRDDT